MDKITTNGKKGVIKVAENKTCRPRFAELHQRRGNFQHDLAYCGGVFATAALTLCVAFAAAHGNVWGVVSGAIYGVTMILLYTMSSIYHGLSPKWTATAKKVFQVIDHCSIYFLIAALIPHHAVRRAADK
jgi:channel protein (hemolysin III family)